MLTFMIFYCIFILTFSSNLWHVLVCVTRLYSNWYAFLVYFYLYYILFNIAIFVHPQHLRHVLRIYMFDYVKTIFWNKPSAVTLTTEYVKQIYDDDDFNDNHYTFRISDVKLITTTYLQNIWRQIRASIQLQRAQPSAYFQHINQILGNKLVASRQIQWLHLVTPRKKRNSVDHQILPASC